MPQNDKPQLSHKSLHQLFPIFVWTFTKFIIFLTPAPKKPRFTCSVSKSLLPDLQLFFGYFDNFYQNICGEKNNFAGLGWVKKGFATY